ncbi:MAG: T9SS type A sorting domain-containing protein [Bacteroidota bacterium]
MKTTISKLFIAFSAFIMNMGVFAQGTPTGVPVIEFSYDASGNRISRQIIIMPPLKSLADTAQGGAQNYADINYNDQLAGHDIVIYPNPVEGWLNIKISNYSPAPESEILLYDLEGRLLITTGCNSEYTRMDLSALPAANYLMNIKLGNEISRWKIVKQ